MSDFYTRKPVPKRRIVFYGFLTAASVAALGYFQQDPHLYIFAGIAGLFIGAFGFALSRTRANVKPLPGERTPAFSRFPTWVRWLFVIGVCATAVAVVLDITHKK